MRKERIHFASKLGISQTGPELDDGVCLGQLKLIAIRRSLGLRVEFSAGEPHRLYVTRVVQGVTDPCPLPVQGGLNFVCLDYKRAGGWGREWLMKWHYVVWKIGELERWLRHRLSHEVSIGFFGLSGLAAVRLKWLIPYALPSCHSES